MIVPKQDIAYFFGAVNQAKSKRGLQPGELIEAINVRQIVEDEYRKRPGYDRTVPAAESGSLTTPWESFVFDGRSFMARDGAGVAWRKDGSTWRNRGTVVRAYPTVRESPAVNSAKHPTIVSAGGNYWVFVVGSGSYSWLIYDTSGNIVKTTASQTAAGIMSLTAVTDGTSLWVLYTISASNSVNYVKYTVASPSTAPTTGTYGTDATTTWDSIDSHVLADGSIAVAVLRVPSNAAALVLWVSYLDPATSQVDASPAAVTTTIGGGSAGNPFGANVSILTSDGSNGSWYCAFVANFHAGTGYDVMLATITKSTLATATTILAVEDPSPGNSGGRGWACGYLADNGDRVVYATLQVAAALTYPFPFTLKRYTYTGATTTATIRRYSYPVSRPVKVGSTFYLLTGYDDGVNTGVLRSYYLIDSAGNILTQIAYGVGSWPGNQSAAPNSGSPYDPTDTPHVAKIIVNGNKLETALLIDVGSGGAAKNDYAPSFISCDLAATYSAPVRLRDGIAGWPGGVPMLAGTSDITHELALMLSPTRQVFNAGAGAPLAGPQVVQHVYRIQDADGTIYRSAPCPAGSTTFNDGAGATVTVQPLTHLLPGVSAKIEVYISAVNQTQPFLHTVVANDTTVDTIAVAVTPGTINASAETIYTFGGGLENAPLPEAKFVSLWRNRTIVGSQREIWPSLEHETGFGPRWNEALVTQWAEGEGDIIAGVPLDWNYFAVFKRNAIAVISGGGPNLTAGGGVSGNYETQTIPVAKGPVNARSVLTGPQGAFFQSTGDGRIYCLVPGLAIVDVSDGMESYRTGTVQAVNYVEKDRQLHFHMDDGAIMVLDYAHPTPTNQFGRWTRWTSSGLLASCGAGVDATGAPAHLETSTGAIRTQGSGFQDATSGAAASVLMTLTSGDLAASGKIKGVFRIDQVNLLGEWISTNTSRLTVSSDYQVTTTTHTTTSLSAAPQELYARPQGHDRAQSVRLKWEETVSTGEGFVFTGVSLTVQPYGMAKFPQANRRVA